MTDLRDPKFSARLQGRVALADLEHTLGLHLDTTGRGLPDALQLDVNAAGSYNQIRVTPWRSTWGIRISRPAAS